MNLRLSQSEAVFLGYAASGRRLIETMEAVDKAIDESDGGEVFVYVPEEDLAEGGLRAWVADHKNAMWKDSPVMTLLAKMSGQP